MIKEEFIEIIGHSRNKNYYTNLGYNVEVGKPFQVKTSDLLSGSAYKITSVCDNCNRETKNAFKDYWNFTKGFKMPYYCSSCKVIKSEKTNLQKWGCKNPMQNENVKAKLKETIMEKYGVSWYSKTDEWLVKFKSTSERRWGFDNPSKNTSIKNDIRNKNKFLQSDEFRNNSKKIKQRNTWKKYAAQLPLDYSVNDYNSDIFTISHSVCEKQFQITKSLVYSRLKNKCEICLECNPIDIFKSSFEREVGLFLEDLGIKFEQNNRTILTSGELDYFIPEYNVAIECNGIYWHNELFKSKNYHLNKTKQCRSLGIDLIHIWEDDWRDSVEIVKSIIKNRLGLIKNRIHARKCKISEVTTSQYKNFLEANHIQGYASSSWNIGLFFEDELVSLMTFGFRKTNNKTEYELIRFCNKINLTVIGSASKLFNYFLKNTSVNRVISYSDISIFSGDIYGKLGFKMTSLSKPNYFWVVGGKRIHRYNFSKRKLVKLGYNENLTEVEIMNDRGYWRIFSTGQEKWVYNLNIDRSQHSTSY